MPTLSTATWQPCACLCHNVRSGYAKFALAWLLSFVLLAARSWLVLQGFHLFAEDGAIFFAGAWNGSFLTAVTTPYAGYYHLLPRLIAEAAALLPHVYAPWTYAAAALVLNATAISWLQLPQYRLLIRNDWLRFAFVFLIAISPNWEAITAISYVQWSLAWWAALVTLMPLDNRWLRLGVAAAYTLAIWTAPILILLLPIWLLRLWRTRARGDVLLVAVFAISHFAYLAATLRAPRDVAVPIDWSASIIDFLRAYAYRVTGANFLGAGWTETIHLQYGWSYLHGFAIAVTLLLLTALIRLHPPQRSFAVAVLLFVGIASLSFYLLRSANFRLPFLTDEAPLALTHRRYFLLTTLALLVLLGMVLDGLPAYCRPATARRAALVTVAVLVLVWAPAFAEPALSGPGWRPYGQLLDRWRSLNPGSGAQTVSVAAGDPLQQPPPPWQAQAQRMFLPFIASESTPAVVSIPVAPQGWAGLMLAPAQRSPFAVVSTGLLLADVQVHTAGGAAQMDFAWQYAAQDSGPTPGAWLISLWLFGGDGRAAACQPLPVALPGAWLQPGQLFFTEAVMPLPSALAAAGGWRIEVAAAACPVTLPIVAPAP